MKPIHLALGLLVVVALGCKKEKDLEPTLSEYVDVTFKGTLRQYCEDSPAPYTSFGFMVKEEKLSYSDVPPVYEKILKTDSLGNYEVTFSMRRKNFKNNPNIYLSINAFNFGFDDLMVYVNPQTYTLYKDIVVRPSYKYQLELRTNGKGNDYTNLDTLFFQGNSSDSTVYPKITYNGYKYFYIVGPFQDRLLSQDIIYMDNNNSNRFWFKYGLPSKGINYGLVEKENIQRCNTTPDVYYIDLP